MAFWGRQLFYIALGVTVLSACSDDQQIEAEILRPVRFQQVSYLQSDVNLKFIGVVKAGTETEFSFKVGGTVRAINATPGTKVKKGALLAELDNSDAMLKYEKQLLTVKNVQVKKETAASGLRRTKGLYENNNVPLSEYEAAREKYTNALASYETEKRALELSKRELGYYKLNIPYDGIVLKSDVSKNENISAGQVVAVIQTGGELVVKVGLPEQTIALVKVDQSVSVDVPSIPGKTFSGVITEVAYTVNPESSTYPVTVKIIEAAKEIRPGMPANVSISLSKSNKGSRLVIPAHSVLKDDTGNFVYLVESKADGNGVVRKKIITVGSITKTGFEVLNGLNAGDKVITAGVSGLVDGMKVRLLK